MPLDLIEFPADDLARARRFWEAPLDAGWPLADDSPPGSAQWR